MSSPLLSVIMPTHNLAAVLHQTVNSILSQTFRNFELICVDDGSQDDSKDILLRYAKKDNRITVLSTPDYGAARARNYGFAHTSGKYVIFLDGDDIFSEKMFERMIDKLERTGADVCACESNRFNHQSGNVDAHYRFPKKYPDGLYRREDLGRDVLQVGCQVPWNKMVRRDLLISKEISFQDIPNNNDALYSALTMWMARSVYFLHEQLVRYRWGMGASVQDLKNSAPDGALSAAEAIYSRLREGCSDERRLDSLFECCLGLALSTLKVAVNTGQYSLSLHRRIISDLGDWKASERKRAVCCKVKSILPLMLLLHSNYDGVVWAYSKRDERREIGSTTIEKVRLAGRTLIVLGGSLFYKA